MSNSPHKIEIIAYSDDLKEHIKTLNYEWLNRYFRVEKGDEISLSNPRAEIIDKGGFVYYAVMNREIVGTVSLLHVKDSVFEIGKMAVTESAQGHGIGTILLEHCLNVAQEKSMTKLVLYSNTLLQAALHLYKKYGFIETELETGLYERANIKMEKDVSNTSSTRRSTHSTNAIFLVKPANFGYNTETAASNAFQHKTTEAASQFIQKAIQEFEIMAKQLADKGVDVTVIEDSKEPIKPDAIFPNNWGSFHRDGTVVLYPMMAKNRRTEKRQEILDQLSEKFEITSLIDLSKNEEKGIFLEGTGSIIFDHAYGIAYACISPRTDKELFTTTCKKLGYQPVCFHAFDRAGEAIYHTNVMMNVGNTYAVICLECITNEIEKELVLSSLQASRKRIIDISNEQMKAFCGNMIELQRPHEKNILALSQLAFKSFTKSQLNTLNEFCELLPLNVATIEHIGGGSVRCMIAEVFLPLKIDNRNL